MDKTQFLIGAYCLAEYAHTEEHVRDIAQCGIDMMVCVPSKKPLLDLLAAHGIGAVVSGVVPGWFGGTGENAGTMEQLRPLEAYDAAAAKFENHPAIWGIDIGDEPSMLDFPHYGKVYKRVNELFPEQFPHLNIYPGYAMVAWNTPEQVARQLGTSDFSAYVDCYCKHVLSDTICFDFYPYSANVELFWENLRIVSDACRRHARSMRVVLQVNSHVPEIWTSANRLRLQAYSALAYGAECILWACYTAGWWHNQVLDKSGSRTQQYDKLRRVNRELKQLGAEYMRYRPVKTHRIQGDQRLCAAGIRDLHAQNGERLIVGERRSEEGAALMICAADDPFDEGGHRFCVFFHIDGKQVSVHDAQGTRFVSSDEYGRAFIFMQSCEGVLLTISA